MGGTGKAARVFGASFCLEVAWWESTQEVNAGRKQHQQALRMGVFSRRWTGTLSEEVVSEDQAGCTR